MLKRLVIISAIIPLGFTQAALAEDYARRIGFFNENAVANHTIPLETTEQQEIEYYPRGFDLSKKEPEQKLEAKLVNGKPGAEQQVPKVALSQEEISKDPQRAQLLSEFGHPKQEVPVKGVETAPGPYKAMLSAIQMGRDDLALEYANQWMGYVRKLDQVTRKAVAMAGVARHSNGSSEELTEDMVANVDPAALEQYLSKKALEKPDSGSLEVSEETLTKIKGLFSEGEISPQSDEPRHPMFDVTLPEDTRRQYIRTKLANSLPRDSSGQVQVLFFLRTTDPKAIKLGEEIGKAISNPDLGVTLSVVSLSMDGVKVGQNMALFNKTGLPAQLRDGAQLSKTMGITGTPALVFVAPTTGAAWITYEEVDSVFVSEVARIIGGRS